MKNKTFGEEIRRLREKERLTREQLAEILDISDGTIKNWESESTFPRNNVDLTPLKKTFHMKDGEYEELINLSLKKTEVDMDSLITKIEEDVLGENPSAKWKSTVRLFFSSVVALLREYGQDITIMKNYSMSPAVYKFCLPAVLEFIEFYERKLLYQMNYLDDMFETLERKERSLGDKNSIVSAWKQLGRCDEETKKDLVVTVRERCCFYNNIYPYEEKFCFEKYEIDESYYRKKEYKLANTFCDEETDENIVMDILLHRLGCEKFYLNEDEIELLRLETLYCREEEELFEPSRKTDLSRLPYEYVQSKGPTKILQSHENLSDAFFVLKRGGMRKVFVRFLLENTVKTEDGEVFSLEALSPRQLLNVTGFLSRKGKRYTCGVPYTLGNDIERDVIRMKKLIENGKITLSQKDIEEINQKLFEIIDTDCGEKEVTRQNSFIKINDEGFALYRWFQKNSLLDLALKNWNSAIS